MADTRCYCSPMTPRTLREGVGTKDPCPIHDSPEFLAALADAIVPAMPTNLKIEPFRYG